MARKKKPLLRTGVAERHVTQDREALWAKLAALVPGFDRSQARDLIDETGAHHHVTETTISYEPPWRVVLDVADGPVGFHQESIVLVPDPGGCIAMWSVLAGPDDDAAHPYSVGVTASAESRLARLLDD